VGILFDDRETPLSANEHDPLCLFDSELSDAAANSETDLRDVDAHAAETGQHADTHSVLGPHPPRRSAANAAFLAGLVTALVLFWFSGWVSAVFTPGDAAWRPFEGQLPPLPPSPWMATHVDVAAVQPPMLSAEELFLQGSLVVESNPVGADVFIDGTRVGKTPLVLPNQREGARSVRVEAKGHDAWAAAVQIVTGQEVSLRADLNLAQPAAKPIPLESEPAEGTASLAVTGANPIVR
jgi:PEGA domain-containing protein